MKQAAKRTSQHLQMPSIKKSQSTRKNDIFDEFEQNRQIFKKDKNNVSTNKIMFKTKQKQKQVEQDDYYNQDFDDLDNSQNNKTKNRSELPAIGNQKKSSKMQQSFKKIGTQVLREEKHGSKHRNARSEMDNSGNNMNSSTAGQLGRYQAEVDKKFGNLSAQTMSNDAINRHNQQIRQLIKRYNQILTELINRNLSQLTSKKKKKVVPIEQSIKILQQQIKNNTKIQQLDITELKKLENYKQRLEEQQNYSQQTLEEQSAEINAKIKELRKYIHDTKLAVQNQGKKLVLPGNIVGSKGEGQSEVTTLKEKLVVIRKEWEKNQERINGLNNREKQLTSKIQQLGDKDKQADELRTNTKKTEDKSKKYQEIKKKYDTIKAHSTKTQALWATKCSVISHENESLKTKVKNMELQIKNVEQSSKLAYDKSNKILLTSKPKNEVHQKAMQKIVGQMNSYSQQNVQRQMSLSQMKLMSKKKVSVDQASMNLKEAEENNVNNQEVEKKEKNGKTSSQESQRNNRVWRQQKQETQVNEKQNSQKHELKISRTQRNTLKGMQKTLTEVDNRQEKKQQANQKKQKPKQQNQPSNQSENKPKKFNFNRNKANSQLNIIKQGEARQSQQQVLLNKQKQEMQINRVQKTSTTTQQHLSNQKQKLKTTNLNQNSNKQPQTKPEQQQIRPKRFNINLKDRKQKQQNSSYQPSMQQKQQKQLRQKQNEQIGPIDPPIQNRELSKPTFNLRKKKEAQAKQKLLPDNQFMGQ